jgi:hypothetical protein
MPSSSNASSNENEHEGHEIVAPMLGHVSRLVDHLAVAPDAVARHVGADVEIGAERGDVRAADVGHADDRARFRIELAEAVKGAGIFGRQDRQIALDEAGSDAGGRSDLAAAIGEPRLAARERVGRFSLLRCHQNSHLIDLPINSTKTANTKHAIKSNLPF